MKIILHNRWNNGKREDIVIEIENDDPLAKFYLKWYRTGYIPDLNITIEIND